MLILKIDKKAGKPIFIQIVNEVIKLIETGTLTAGYPMPSTRQLSEKLGINRSTVVRAYEELWSLGYLESHMGSYTRVRNRKNIAKKDHDTENNSFANQIFSATKSIGIQNVSSFSQLLTPDDSKLINFQKLEPDPKLIDRSHFAKCFRESLNDNIVNVFGYCHPNGYEPLRKEILRHMQLHSINANLENLLITNGSHNSLQLVIQNFIKRDDIVVIESPTYSMVIPLLRYLKVKVAEVPMENDGINLKVLKKIMETKSVRLIYTMPSFHNPSGITMSQKKRENLLQLCEKHNTILVEDSFEEEMKFFGRAHLPIKSMDSKEIVIYLSSFSKILSPGLRIGWIIANPQCIMQLSKLKTAFDLSSNTMSQVILYHFCKSGGYELHIRKVMRTFRKRLKTALTALKKFIPKEKASWIEPLGGFLIWIKIHNNKAIDLSEHFKKYGVLVSNGSSFYYSAAKDNFIRISISRNTCEEIEEGIKRIGIGLNFI